VLGATLGCKWSLLTALLLLTSVTSTLVATNAAAQRLEGSNGVCRHIQSWCI
jgi:hypothetical protein